VPRPQLQATLRCHTEMPGHIETPAPGHPEIPGHAEIPGYAEMPDHTEMTGHIETSAPGFTKIPGYRNTNSSATQAALRYQPNRDPVPRPHSSLGGCFSPYINRSAFYGIYDYRYAWCGYQHTSCPEFWTSLAMVLNKRILGPLGGSLLRPSQPSFPVTVMQWTQTREY
jgi:hypothetical protein